MPTDDAVDEASEPGLGCAVLLAFLVTVATILVCVGGGILFVWVLSHVMIP